MSKSARWFAAAAAIVLLDQLTKWLVLARFAPGERLELTSFFNMVLVFNKGAAFSLFASAPGWQTPLLATFALVAAAIVSVLIVRNPERRLMCFGLALILGGAMGNLVDRLRQGYVIDFVDVYWRGWHFWAFNVADASITIGAVLVFLDLLVVSRHASHSV